MNPLGGSPRENMVAVGVGVVGMTLLALSFISPVRPTSIEWVLAVGLVICLVLADRFPIHARYATKIVMTSVPLFLMAAVLPHSLSLIAGFLGNQITCYLARKERGLLPIDFIIIPSRWVIILFLVNLIAQSPARSGIFNAPYYLLAALVMFAADILTFALFTSLSIKEPFWGLVRDLVRQTFLVESVQYLIGILGAIAYQQAFWAPALLVFPTILAYWTSKNLKEMRRETREVLISMADAVDLRDMYTGGHSRRVASLVVQILQEMQIGGVEAELIETAARLHDIGKIDIPDTVLLKHGALTADERRVMQAHTVKGSSLLACYPDFSRGAQIVLSHHERWDGNGYPRGLKAHEIPFGARIIAVADGFDAMTTDRPYRSRKTPREAIQELIKGGGTQWDPEIVKIFVELWNRQSAEETHSQPVPSSSPIS